MPRRRPFGKKLFLYFTGMVLLLISESLYDMAFAIHAYEISGMAKVGALTYAFGYLAEILVGLAFGGFFDRFRMHVIYATAIMLKIAAFLTVVAVARTQEVGIHSLWVFAFVIDALHHITKMANTVSLVDLCSEEELPRAHGYLAVGTSAFAVVGPALSAALIAVMGAMESLIVCTLSQSIAIVVYYLAFKEGRSERPREGGFEKAFRGTIESLRSVLASRDWTLLFLTNALVTLLTGSLILLFVPVVRKHYMANEQEIGLFFAAAALGSVTAGAALAKLHDKLDQRLTIAACILALSLTSAALVLSGSFWLALPVAFLFNFAMTTYYRTTALLLQTHAPRSQVGAFYSASDVVSRVFGMLGIIAAGYVFDGPGHRVLYVGSALCLMLVASAVFLWGDRLTLQQAALDASPAGARMSSEPGLQLRR